MCVSLSCWKKRQTQTMSIQYKTEHACNTQQPTSKDKQAQQAQQNQSKHIDKSNIHIRLWKQDAAINKTNLSTTEKINAKAAKSKANSKATNNSEHKHLKPTHRAKSKAKSRAKQSKASHNKQRAKQATHANQNNTQNKASEANTARPCRAKQSQGSTKPSNS